MNLSRKETITALEPLKPALASARAAIEGLSHIWFDGAYAYATNGGMGIKAKFASPFKCGIPGSLFLGLLNQAAADTLEFTATNNELKLKTGGRSSIKLSTLPLEQRVWRYPDKPNTKPLASLKVSEGFLKGLKRVFVLKPSSPKRMEHHAVCIFAAGKEIDIYVTDSKSLLVMPVAEQITGTAKKLALPRELAEQLASQSKAGQKLELYDDHFAVQANDKVALYSNVFDTSEMLDLPSYADRFADEKAMPSFVLPEGFNAALERAALLAGTEEPTIALKAQGKSLKLSGKFKFGQIEEDWPIKVATKATLSVDAKVLLSVKDVNKMAMSDSVVTFLGEDNFMYALAAKGGPAASREEAPQDEEDVAPPRRQPTKRPTVSDMDDEIPF